jgi:hypothetical protein
MTAKESTKKVDDGLDLDISPQAEVKQEAATTARRERIPLGTPRMKLNVSKPMLDYFNARGEVLRWINDEPGRLEAATVEDSYRFVTKNEFPDIYKIGQGDLTEREGIDSRISRVVGTRDSGVPVTAYLMAKPKADYDADQMEKAALIDQKEDAMRRGVDSYGRPGDSEGRYIPSPGIKITRG